MPHSCYEFALRIYVRCCFSLAYDARYSLRGKPRKSRGPLPAHQRRALVPGGAHFCSLVCLVNMYFGYAAELMSAPYDRMASTPATLGISTTRLLVEYRHCICPTVAFVLHGGFLGWYAMTAIYFGGSDLLSLCASAFFTFLEMPPSSSDAWMAFSGQIALHLKLSQTKGFQSLRPTS